MTMIDVNDLSKIGKIEEGVDKTSVQSLNRNPLTRAMARQLEDMRVGESFLLSCEPDDLVAYRAMCHHAAKKADVKISTRHRKHHVHREDGIRVWREHDTDENKRVFSLSDSR